MLPLLPVPMDVAQQAWIQIHAEERYRAGNDVDAEETEIQPELRYDAIWKGGNAHFVAIYQPRFVYTDVFKTPDADPNVVNLGTISTYEPDAQGNGFHKADPNKNPLSALQNGGLGLELMYPRWRLSLYQFGAYGPVTTTTLLVQTPWNGDGYPVDPNPIIPSTVAGRFTLLFLQTQAFAPIRVSRRLSITPGFVYNAFGGATSASRAAMALTQGPGASVDVEYAATVNDRLVSHVGAGTVNTAFEGDRTGPTIYRGEATQAWRHWYTGRLSTEVTVGGSVGGDNINGSAAYSVTSVGLLYDTYSLVKLEPGAPAQGPPPGHGDRFQVGAVVKAGPWLDLFSGDLEERAVGVLATNYTVDRTTFRAQGAGARVFNTPHSVAKYLLFSAEGGIRYAFSQTFSGEVGLRYGHQDFSNAIRFNEIDQITVFGGLLWAPNPARF
ncbi:MAG TPA: hypothetical protein VIF62_34915 [Labilithrix sp.]|jgi:hypothetical protein